MTMVATMVAVIAERSDNNSDNDVPWRWASGVLMITIAMGERSDGNGDDDGNDDNNNDDDNDGNVGAE